MKELKVVPPDGYVIDEENSTFECIKFKPKELTYDDIARKLFYYKLNVHYIDTDGNVKSYFYYCADGYKAKNHAVSEKQCQRILAINQLMNVAYYFNNIVDAGVWNTHRFHLCISEKGEVSYWKEANPYKTTGFVYFKTEESIKEAIKILGEETIKLAISL